MNTANDFRIAKWLGNVTPDPEQRAFIEKQMEDARTWLKYGERRLEAWRKEMRERKERVSGSDCSLLQAQAS